MEVSMRTLVIAEDFPWPTDSGARLRLVSVLRGLSRCGPTELASVVSKFRSDFGDTDPAMGLVKVERIGFDNRPPSGIGLAATLVRPSMPFGLPWRDGPLVQAAISRFATGTYDLVWYFGARSWVLAGATAEVPTVVDLIDLEDQKILARLAVPRPPAVGAAAQLRRVVATQVSREEVRRWQRLHRRVERSGATTVVCSTTDTKRATTAGVKHVAAVANGYDVPLSPLGREEVASPATVLFPGLLTYPPNVDAARLLAQEIGPALREWVPDAQIRLVGNHDGKLDDLQDPPRVTVTGRVDDIGDELGRADLVVVPLRYGSGTRLKILEAFAHRIPVVSTTLGAEGLGAEDGTHLLVADSVPNLAQACSRLLTDVALRRTIVERAHSLFLERFQSEIIEEQVASLARQVAGVDASSPGDRPTTVPD
jgi:glycosyltransferase involved in cell wall biosynthesis